MPHRLKQRSKEAWVDNTINHRKAPAPYDIAIVSMAGLVPGANTLDAFWDNLIHKRDACQEVGKDRWRIDPAVMTSERPQPDKAISRTACLLNPAMDYCFDGLDLGQDLMNKKLEVFFQTLKGNHACLG